MPDTSRSTEANAVRRRLPQPSTLPDIAAQCPAAQRPTYGRLEIALLILAVTVGIVCAARDVAAFERPTRDGVDDLPVWSIQRCTPQGCATMPLLLEDGSRVLVIRRICAAMRDQAAPQIRDRLVCRPEPDAVSQLLGSIEIVR